MVDGWCVAVGVCRSVCGAVMNISTMTEPEPIDRRPSTIDQPPGMLLAETHCMKAKNIDDVVVYKEALVAEDEVSAILER